MKPNDDRRLPIAFDGGPGEASVTLDLDEHGPWCGLLGAWPAPAAGSLDRLAEAIEAAPETPRSVTLEGCPSACLLPIAWLRTIWLGADAEVRVVWRRVDDPTGQRGRAEAARLARAMIDRLDCGDPARAAALWGLDQDGSPADTGEPFDTLSSMIDLWDTDLASGPIGAGWCDTVRRAFAALSSAGARRVALYGAGTHTRAIGEALMDPEVEIVAIIDDDARRSGQRLWGYPIVTRERALELKPDAVVLSANSIEHVLWDNSRAFREAGIRVTRLYSRDGETPDGGDPADRENRTL